VETARRLPDRTEEIEVPSGAQLNASASFLERPHVRGKFLFVGDRKLLVKGVTYGTFRPDPETGDYPTPETVRKDFSWMAAAGINAVRVYTVPPRWVLDEALQHGLRIMVGLPWEQHVAFLSDNTRRKDIERRVREGARSCAGHPAVLCYSVGNEIPAAIVRWHGRRKIERYLERLAGAVREEDPGALVTYVSYPTTEYLDLPFLDIVCFNVFLESQEHLDAYLGRLHNVAGDRPLMLTEIGLDARSNGQDVQAATLDWQIRSAFASGSAGAFVFSWTDDWYRGGEEVDGWEFGLTSRDRHPKPVLGAVRKAFIETPFPPDVHWPRISVVVCSHNGERTLDECLRGIGALEYPDYEVIVVDDGSSDATADIARRHDVRLISTPHRGLSSARNTGLEAASGEIVAYLDDDAYPDEDWLTYLAAAFRTGDYVAVGGPNLPPRGDGPIAECVANAPGGPAHVLLSDREAEHIPGCNMAFQKNALEEIGGFDTQFWAAGDDVDVCWRLQEQGWKLGFSPPAVVWHHRRNSVVAFLRQQRTYGKAEALLERKWPDRYNGLGHLSWSGRIYGNGTKSGLFRRPRIYQGKWGTAPFQFVTGEADGHLASAVSLPEWFLVVLVLGIVSIVGALWQPLILGLPLFLAALVAPIGNAIAAGVRARLPDHGVSPLRRAKLRALTALLHVAQPAARLWGRLSYGLSPWRHHRRAGWTLPLPFQRTIWSERWRSPEDWIRSIERRIRARGAPVVHGGPLDRWDLEVRGGALGGTRVRVAIEEHGQGRQLARLRSWPVPALLTTGVATVFAALAVAAAVSGAIPAAFALGVLAAAPLAVSVKQLASATSSLGAALDEEERRCSV
jgi:GT2 family glycosyltransferase